MIAKLSARRRKSTAALPKATVEELAPIAVMKAPRDCHKYASTISQPPQGFEAPPRGSLNREKIVYLSWRLSIIYNARLAEYQEEDRRRSDSSSLSSSPASSSSPSTTRSSHSQQWQRLPLVIHPDNIEAIAAAAGAAPPSPPMAKRPLISSHYASHKVAARNALSSTLRLQDDELDDKFAFLSMPILSLDPANDISMRNAVLAAGQQAVGGADAGEAVEVLEQFDEEEAEEDDGDSLSTTSSSDPSTSSGGDAESLPTKTMAVEATRRRHAKRFLSLIGLRAEAAQDRGFKSDKKSSGRKIEHKIAVDESLAELRFQAGLWY